MQVQDTHSLRDAGQGRRPHSQRPLLNTLEKANRRARRTALLLLKAEQENSSLREQIAQYALLVKEVDHRAKNSLQLAASMLLLQARQKAAESAAPHLHRAVERLRALAEIHRASYLAEDFDQILVSSWLTTVCRSLSFDPLIRLDIICPDLVWPFDVAGPAGLFVSEALANGCKHAFDGRAGTMQVSLEPADAGLWRLTVADDGKGMEPGDQKGLGGRLLSTFAHQLRGSLHYGLGLNGRGVSVAVEFPFPG